MGMYARGNECMGVALGRKLPLSSCESVVSSKHWGIFVERENEWLSQCLACLQAPFFSCTIWTSCAGSSSLREGPGTEPPLCSPQWRPVSGLEGPLSAHGFESVKPLQRAITSADPRADPEKVERPSGSCLRKALPQVPSIKGLLSKKARLRE